jgi:4-amino-4-deoxy-L-arabinose transferase-like glycosyltransferase
MKTADLCDHGKSAALTPRDRNRLGLLAIIVAQLTIVRLIGLKFSDVGLFYDEAQYWSWAQDPAFGYPTKPPLLAWLLTGVHYVCGDSEWCVRSPAPIIYAAMSMVIYALAQRLYGESEGFWAAIVAAFTTGIVFSSRIISTDVPLLLCFALALLAYVNILQSQGRGQIGWGTVLGVSTGLGLLAKYAMIYLVPGALLAGLLDPRARALWRDPAIWLSGLIAAVIVAPNLVWNIQHSFTTFRHTGGLVLDESFQPSLLRGLEFLASQLAVIGPVTFTVMVIAAAGFRSRVLVTQDRLMLAFFIAPIIPVTLFAIYSQAFANWAAPAVVPAIVGSTAILLRSGHRIWLWAGIAIGVVLQSVLLVTDTMASRLPARVAGFRNPYERILVWRSYAENAGALAERMGTQAIAAEDRRVFDSLQYYWRDRPQVIVSWDISGEPPFDLWHKLTASTPQPILFVTGCPDAERLAAHFSKVEPLGIHPGRQDQRSLHFHAFRLGQLRPLSGPLEPCNIAGLVKQGPAAETKP